MGEYRSRIRRSRFIPLVAVAILGLSLLSGCGGNKKVEFSISPAGLSQVQNAAPSKDYALYVPTTAVPASAADIGSYSLVQCIAGETAVNRGMAVLQGLQTGTGGSHNVSIAAGDGTADGIKKALAGQVTSGGKCLVLVKRGSPVPSDAVEVVLK